ncbi:MAG: metal-dependent transcriptional regulator [candidate division Zixibacteria bacterium]|jgi:DtxR family Mn-dependent transcriptional regulator|nr:metal-dependent transcriptional regulator [candidate division Zixibacteria bacterium]
MLTAAQQDYIEVIYRLEQDAGDTGVRVTAIADALGTRLPTVSRTVRKLAILKLVTHDARREVALTAGGRRIAREIVHRHEDLVRFFVLVLGLSENEAERDACQIEHGLSGKASQRLHEFLEHVQQLTADKRRVVTGYLRTASPKARDFENLPDRRIDGWRK